MPKIKTDSLTIKDVHDILKGKKFHRELTTKEKEQIEEYKKQTKIFYEHLTCLTEGLQAKFGNSLLSFVVEDQKTVQTFSKNLTSLIDSQNRIAEITQSLIAPIQNMVKVVQSIGFALAETQKKLKQGLELARIIQDLLKNVLSSIPNMNKLLKNNFLFVSDFTNILNIVKNNGKYLKRITEITRNIGEDIVKISVYIQKIMKLFVELYFLLNKKNFFLILRASRGDTSALHQLGKLWWKLFVSYCDVEKRKGRKPTKREFHRMVQTACWEVIQQNQEKEILVFNLPRAVYYYIIGKLKVDYIEVITTIRLDENISIEIVAGRYNKSKIIPYYDEQNKPNFFVKTVAEEIGVTAQTIRNWIKTGKISSVRSSYYSKIRKAIISTHFLPYRANLIDDLRKLKQEHENKKLHRLDGYYTISQLSELYGLSRKTFERWEKEGKLIPKRINGIRYYNEQQKETIPHILVKNNSPKVKALLATPRLVLV